MVRMVQSSQAKPAPGVAFGGLKRVISALGLKRPASAILQAFIRRLREKNPKRICTRNGVTFETDLREVIDTAIYLGGWEPGTLAFLGDVVKPGDVVVEVGANIGAHTLPIAKMAGASGHVYAFEPTVFARTKLLRNIALNPDFSGNVTVYSQPVTNKELAMSRTEIQSAWREGQAPHSETIDTPPTTLDDFVIQANPARVSLLKVDVDGYDYKVLQGGVDLLQRFRPLVFVELCEYTLREQGDSVRDILALLQGMGYRGFYENGKPIVSADEVLEMIGMDTSTNGMFRPA
jgi:FkbM family methyltransferase